MVPMISGAAGGYQERVYRQPNSLAFTQPAISSYQLIDARDLLEENYYVSPRTDKTCQISHRNGMYR